MGKLIRAMTTDGSARIAAIDGKDIVERSRQIHQTLPTATAGLGRALMASSMMGALMNDENATLTLRFSGDGEGGQILCVGDYNGNVRGLIGNPFADIPLRADGKLDVTRLVGKGTMSVIRDTGASQPYVGLCQINSGEIAEDIAQYFVESEQIPTLCALGVLVDRDMTVKCAGGVLIQLLPFFDDCTASQLEKNAGNVPSVTKMLQEGTIEDVMARFLEGVSYDVFDETEVSYKCFCSRERCERSLMALGEDDYKSLYEDDKTVMTCSFCDRKYVFSHSDLDKLDEERKRKSREKK